MKTLKLNLILAGCAIFCMGKGFAQPHIEFDSTVFNFGEGATGEPIVHNFTFTNTGNQTLEISDVRPTCGCTVAGVWDKRIEPGKIGTIPIRYTPKYDDKDVNKTVIVLANDPGQTNTILQIVGKIWQPINISSSFVMFGVTTDSLSNQTQSVRIINNLPQPLALFEPMSSDRSLKASIKTVRPGKEFELQMSLVPPLKAGSATVPVTVKTSSSILPIINITAFITVKARVSATPAQIVLPPGPLSSAIESRVTIQNNGDRPIVLAQPVTDASGIKFQLREIKNGREFLLTASFPAGFQLESAKNVQLKTDDPTFPSVTVPIVQNKHLAAVLDEKSDSESPHDGNK